MNSKIILREEDCEYTQFISKCEKQQFKYFIKCKTNHESVGPAAACNTLKAMLPILLEYTYRGFSYKVTFVDEAKASKYIGISHE